MLEKSFVFLVGSAIPTFAFAQSVLTVIPAAHATSDANSHLWLPGASDHVRQQTLVGESHLVQLVGRSLTALEFRRTAANEHYAPGCANMTVTLSLSPQRPLHTSPTFTANIGANPVVVFAGLVALTGSQAAPGPTVAWTPSNLVRIPFQTPFVYSGGTLCIDVIGSPVLGQQTWWLADAVFEDITGTAAEVGSGCGPYGGMLGRWSWTYERKLIPGNHAEFFAQGPHGAIGFVGFGARSPMPLPLTGLGSPVGCDLHLATIDILLPTLFTGGLPAGPGVASVQFWIPDDISVLGASMTAQWLEWGLRTTSNAMQVTIAGTIPTLDLTTVEGHPTSPIGNVAVGHAHVLRLEHQ
jgi:hypothetical protein